MLHQGLLVVLFYLQKCRHPEIPVPCCTAEAVQRLDSFDICLFFCHESRCFSRRQHAIRSCIMVPKWSGTPGNLFFSCSLSDTFHSDRKPCRCRQTSGQAVQSEKGKVLANNKFWMSSIGTGRAQMSGTDVHS